MIREICYNLKMKLLKAFIAGLAFPATLLPIVYLILYLSGHSEVRSQPLQFMPLFIPIVFGLWNIIYFAIGEKCPVKNKSMRLWIWGALLGLLVALIGVFIIGLPKLLFGFTGSMQYLPLIVVPIIYGLIWRYIVSVLNSLLSLEEW